MPLHSGGLLRRKRVQKKRHELDRAAFSELFGLKKSIERQKVFPRGQLLQGLR
jgi:hypothetical protein